MPSNEIIKGEDVGQELNFWISNLAILNTIVAEDELSWHPFSLRNYTPPLFRQRSTNKTVR
jgi:hypothetical protein